MPITLPNNKIAATLDELVPDYWPSYDALHKAIKRTEGLNYGIKRVEGIAMPGKGKGRHLTVYFDTLPTHVQEGLGDPRKGKHIMELYFEVDNQAMSYYSQRENGYRNDEQYLSLVCNASLLNAAKKLLHDREIEIRNKGGIIKRRWQVLHNDVVSFAPILTERLNMTHTLPDCYRAFQRKYAVYHANNIRNYEVLVHKGQNNKNNAKVKEDVHEFLKALFRGWEKKPGYTDVTDYYQGFLNGKVDVVKDDKTGELFMPENFAPLGRSTIYNWLSKWDTKIGTDAIGSGNRQVLKGKYIPHHSMEKELYAGSIISVDDRQPPFWYAERTRMWFYLGQDVASQCITTWVWGKTKEEIILEFYRQMVRNYAAWGFSLPYEIECESALNSTLTHGILRPGNMFTEVRIEANNARGKYIEQGFNRTTRYHKDLEKGDNGWIGRHSAKLESNQPSLQKLPIIPYNELVEARLTDIEVYNNMPHPLKPELTRWEYFAQHQHPELRPINWRGILKYLGYCTTTSCNAGIIRFNNSEHLIAQDGEICTGDKLIENMRLIEGKKVDVYWLDDNEGNVLRAIVYIGDSFQCEAMPKPLSKRSKLESEDRHNEARELMNKYVGTIQAYQTKQAKSVQRVIVIDNREVTLNNNFKITNRPLKKETPVVQQTIEAAILPELHPDDDFEYVNTGTYTQSLKERF